MKDIVALVTELGSFGLLLGLAGWIIYDYIKNKGNRSDSRNIDDNIIEIKKSVNTLNVKVASLEDSIIEIKTNSLNGHQSQTKDSHSKQFLDRLKLGPQIHRSLNNFCNRINADHVFVGSFHNGNESINGIPYYKFDIIAERFCKNKVEDDIEFASMYKDIDLLRHDLLPSEVVQQGLVHYTIYDDKENELEEVDDIIYRRMVGRGIRQLAISLLHDPTTGMPSGFIGCVKYNYDNIDLNELRECCRELEEIYESNEKLIITKHL